MKMNTNLNSAIRLTDSLERELLAAALIEQNEYYLNNALRTLMGKVISIFKGPKVTIHHATRTAH